jgi:cell division septal protein FtsQ
MQDASVSSDAPSRGYLRNRTLSGVIPAPGESSRGQAHHLVAQRRRLGSIFLLILGAIIVLALILGQITAKVTVGIVGTNLSESPDTAAYAKAISEYLNSNPVERLRFTLSTGQLMTALDTTHPEIASVKQTTVWGLGTTNFAIGLRQPVAGWQINHQQYYVDATGVAFQKNYFDAPSVQIVDQSGATPASTRFLSFIGKIVSVAKGRGYSVTQATLPAGTTRELAIHLADIHPEIRLSIDRGAGEQIEDMDRSLKYLTTKGLTPQYIDVRIAGKAYYQ